jgi:hypothetical protein
MITHPQIHAFRAGCHTDGAGIETCFSPADVAAIAASYDPAVHKAPIVLGHPASDDPAYGWVGGLDAQGGDLYAHPDQISADLAEAVRRGDYRNVSVSLYRPDSPNNPKPGAYYLRHLGVLGASVPAVKGLAPLKFASGDDFLTIQFTEHSMQPDKTAEFAEREAAIQAKEAEFAEREAAIQAKEAEIAAAAARKRRAGIVEFAEKLAAEGRVLPRQKAGLVEFMAGLSDTVEIEFAEGDGAVKKPSVDWLRGFLAELPRQVDYAERSAPAALDPATDPLLADAERRAKAAR